VNKFKELVVWQKSIDLTIFIYSLTNRFPKKEEFTLVSQINRACISIASDIAEGAGRNSKKEFYNFLGISVGSSFELETQLIISHRLNYIETESYNKATLLINEIQNMIFKLQKTLQPNT
jgi:four helix bundle protein